MLTPDSIIPSFKDPQNLNLYTYGLNNPVRYRDPTGHCTENYRYDSEYLTLCLEGWSLLSQYYLDQEEPYPHLFMNEVMRSYDVSMIDYLLQALEIDWSYELPDRRPITTPPNTHQDCYQHQGMMVCSPEGGWPKYYPVSDEDKELMAEILEHVTVGFLTGRLITRPIVKMFISDSLRQRLIATIINGLAVAPAAQGTIDIVQEVQAMEAQDVCNQYEPGNISIFSFELVPGTSTPLPTPDLAIDAEFQKFFFIGSPNGRQ